MSLKKAIILVVFIFGFVAFFVLRGDRYLTLDTIKANRDFLLNYTHHHFEAMLFGALILYTVSTALSLPVATVLSLAVGFLFGRWVGTAVIVFSATLGATFAFLAARYIFSEAVQRRMGPHGRKIIEGFHKNDFNYLLFLRLVPLFPFWLVNLVPAFTPIKVRTYVAATATGIIPGSFVFANLGQSLASIDSLKHLLSFETLGAFLLLGLFALVPIILKKARTRVHP